MRLFKAILVTVLAVFTALVTIGCLDDSDARHLSFGNNGVRITDSVAWGYLIGALIFLILTIILIRQSVRYWKAAR